MTIIAWDGNVLASDTMYTQENNKGQTRKLFIIRHPVFGKMIAGFCGTTKGTSIMIKQIEANIVNKVEDYEASLIYGIAIDCNKNVYDVYGDGLVVVQECQLDVPSAVTAGSAWDYTLGAMHAGLSAKDAIELAIKNRVDAGFDIDYYSWSDVFKEDEGNEPPFTIPF